MGQLEALAARLSRRERRAVSLATHRPAAVLVPLVARAGRLHLVFTLRSSSLPSHAGQNSFPGGGCDPADRDLVATALREADEEIGVAASATRVLGLLDDVATPTGFVITPVVASLFPPPEAYRPSQREVSEVFEVPLATLADPHIFEDQGAVELGGHSYRLVAYRPGGRLIWGATARIVWNLLDVL